ncbi:MAG: NAD(P)H dehydrogenase (quinone) [Chlamydiales bacterium]|nr:NAD(P)H dehydrogenase (quinone) [Chlamydiales bacterium]
MGTVFIVYASQWGNTQKMAEAIAEGVSQVEGMQANLKKAPEASAEDVTAADALILGSPVHMGSMDWQVKKFIDEVCSKLWMEDKLVGKVGGVFATGSGYGGGGGGCELTLLSMMNNLVELGLIMVPLPKRTPGYAEAGLQWGPYGRSMGHNMEQTGLTDEKLVAARYHGMHIARAVAALQSAKIFE